ncbi:MAG: ParB/RepB/Spo0J family partition protein [Nitrospirota bacterium]
MQRKALGLGMLGEIKEGAKPIGLGIAALMPPPLPPTPPAPAIKPGPIEIEIANIVPNRYQPREHFDQAALDSLAQSILKNGVIQPIIVRPLTEKDTLNGSNQFELIAGERRMRAALIAGFSKIPAVIKEADNHLSMEYALLENIQREALNPIEQAKGYARLLSEFNLTQEMISERIGVNRSTIANTLRLLHLPESLWDEISAGAISMGHAKALLSLPTKALQLSAAEQIKLKALSVRQIEALVKTLVKNTGSRQKNSVGNLSPVAPGTEDLRSLENRIQQALGTKVRILSHGKDQSKGAITIEYYSLDDLDRILDKLTL